MNRPLIELADVIRAAADRLLDRHPAWLSWLHVKVLMAEVFRGKFADALKQAFAAGELQFYGQLKVLAQPRVFKSFLRQLFRPKWVVYCKPPFGGPDQVLRYLGAYTHRVAISNYRLVAFEDEKVTFRFRDSADTTKSAS